MNKVYLGVPSHDGRVGQGIVNAVLAAIPLAAKMCIESGSALTCNFNNLYAKALNARREGITHFLMLHEDVWPLQRTWMKDMLRIMENYKADILSVVVRLKTDDGKTSTAIEEPDSNPLGFKARKLFLNEIKEPTFTDPMLLLNTGCMLIDIRHDWADKLHFEFRDWLGKSKDGTYFPVSLAEDYGLSRMTRAHGLKLYATTEIETYHMGGGKFLNRMEA